jgi:hypothetical protein
MEIVLEVSQKKKQKQKQKLKIELLCDSTIPLFSIHPKELKPGVNETSGPIVYCSTVHNSQDIE